MMNRDETEKRIAIIGGGVSGALTAYHLIRQGVKAKVIVIDPHANLGLGLAYATPSLRHLLNVPAGKISAIPQEPDHFLRWLRANYDPSATEMTFAPRAVFGQYIRSLLSDINGIEHAQTSVIDLRTIEGRALLTLEDGNEIKADVVVLATGNFDPVELPGVHEAACRTGVYRHNAWAADTYDDLPVDAPVTLIGTGLTGVDVVLRLRELGHRGTIVAVSRHGVLPNRHADYVPMRESAIPSDTTATCLAYLRALRKAIHDGADWRGAVDSLRATTNALWLALPLDEQKRFRRHLQRRWDVVRHRMAPPIADVIEDELKARTLVLLEGVFAGVDVVDGGAVVSIQTKKGMETFQSKRVINCTGPSMNYRRVKSPLLHSLFAQGLVSAGPLGGGFGCTDKGAIVDSSGHASEVLYSLGPGRLGNLLESIAVPEIRMEAIDLAATIARKLGRYSQEDLTPPMLTTKQVSMTMQAVSA